MFTVSRLASECGVSRSTLLHYEHLGLLRRPPRTSGNYRAYGEIDVQRLRQICVYRKLGIPLLSIRTLLERPGRSDAVAVLERRLLEIDGQIEQLRAHQHAILRLLASAGRVGRAKMITKDKWVAIMRSAGFTEEDMHRWHTEFEKSAPTEHEEFLEFLHISPEEIRAIRDWAREEAAGRR